jgi:hypothetical protein
MATLVRQPGPTNWRADGPARQWRRNVVDGASKGFMLAVGGVGVGLVISADDRRLLSSLLYGGGFDGPIT